MLSKIKFLVITPRFNCIYTVFSIPPNFIDRRIFYEIDYRASVLITVVRRSLPFATEPPIRPFGDHNRAILGHGVQFLPEDHNHYNQSLKIHRYFHH